MTPEQRAESLVTSPEGIDAIRHGGTFRLESLIAAAIREAEEAIGNVAMKSIEDAKLCEREQCALLAEIAASRAWGSPIVACHRIAKAIRARASQ